MNTAPFPWFGGKRRVASEVWAAIGDVHNYVEPFAGSLAVLLGRPDDFDRWHTGAETVNDADNYLANFWRALAADPEAVAHHCDWPVNETDLISRHLWLVNSGSERIAKLEHDPDFYDAQVAGWWVWGINSWIGSGWCSGKGPWKLGDDCVEKVSRHAGLGVWRQRPHLASAGRGCVNRKLPHLGNCAPGPDLPMVWQGNQSLVEYFAQLAARLRRVRVCCGDWSRVVTKGATAYGKTVGVFLDPPYLGDVRTRDLYRVDDHEISHAVREWCIEHGDDPRLRIVLAGYTNEHDADMPDIWRRHYYKGSTAYQTSGGGGVNATNRHKECLWFSPHCLSAEADEPVGMFANGGGAE